MSGWLTGAPPNGHTTRGGGCDAHGDAAGRKVAPKRLLEGLAVVDAEPLVRPDGEATIVLVERGGEQGARRGRRHAAVLWGRRGDNCNVVSQQTVSSYRGRTPISGETGCRDSRRVQRSGWWWWRSGVVLCCSTAWAETTYSRVTPIRPKLKICNRADCAGQSDFTSRTEATVSHTRRCSLYNNCRSRFCVQICVGRFGLG